MTENEERLVQRILGLLGYTDEKTLQHSMEETLCRAYSDIEILQYKAKIGKAFLRAHDLATYYHGQRP